MNTHDMQKKPWRKDHQIWHVIDLCNGEVIASSPNQSWRGTVAEFRQLFVDATIPVQALEITQNQIWQHVPTGIKHATISGVVQSRVLMENLVDGTASWWPLEDLLNEFEQVIK